MMICFACWFTLSKQIVTPIGKLRLSIPLALTQGFSSFNALEIECLDGDTQTNVAKLVLCGGKQSKYVLSCNGKAFAYDSIPLAELAVQLCIHASGCSVADIELHSDTINLTNFNLDKLADKPDDEIVDWIGTEREVILPLPKRLLHQHHMLHRGFRALLVNAKTNEIFVHKRASAQNTLPSMLDMFVGGVSLHKEAVLTTLLRVLEEQASIDLCDTELPALDNGKARTRSQLLHTYQEARTELVNENCVTYLGEAIVLTDDTPCLVDCFAVRLSSLHADNIFFPEAAWGQWMSPSKIWHC